MDVARADDYEIRFTEACQNDATPCYGFYTTSLGGGVAEMRVVRVPFEAYSVGLTANDDREDVASGQFTGHLSGP